MASDPYAKRLVNQLDGLPLALTTAGAYLSLVSTSLKDYLHYYKTSWLKLQQKSPDLLSYEDRTLYTTWNLSLKHIESQNNSARKLLWLWAYFDNQDLWFQLLAAGREGSPKWFSMIVKDELSFNKVIRLLCDHALIESLKVFGGYGMHTCVHAWVMHVLNAERKISMTRLALTCVSSAMSSEDVPEYWAIERRLLSHARKCSEFVCRGIDFKSQDDLIILSTVHDLGVLFKNQDKLEDTKAVYQWALEDKEKVLGPEHAMTLDTVNNLGTVYAEQDKLEEAEALYQRALKDKERVWGSDHMVTLHTVNNLDNLYKNQGKLKNTQAIYQQALKSYEKTCGLKHMLTLITVNNLGNLY